MYQFSSVHISKIDGPERSFKEKPLHSKTHLKGEHIAVIVMIEVVEIFLGFWEYCGVVGLFLMRPKMIVSVSVSVLIPRDPNLKSRSRSRFHETQNESHSYGLVSMSPKMKVWVSVSIQRDSK